MFHQILLLEQIKEFIDAFLGSDESVKQYFAAEGAQRLHQAAYFLQTDLDVRFTAWSQVYFYPVDPLISPYVLE